MLKYHFKSSIYSLRELHSILSQFNWIKFSFLKQRWHSPFMWIFFCFKRFSFSSLYSDFNSFISSHPNSFYLFLDLNQFTSLFSNFVGFFFNLSWINYLYLFNYHCLFNFNLYIDLNYFIFTEFKLFYHLLNLILIHFIFFY